MRGSFKLKVVSFGKFQAFFAGLAGLICGIIYSFGGLIIDSMVSLGLASPEAMETPGLSYGTILAFGALIGMPLIGVVFGFALGIIVALMYNWFFRKYDLIKIDFLTK
jgi:hypothetical protein